MHMTMDSESLFQDGVSDDHRASGRFGDTPTPLMSADKEATMREAEELYDLAKRYQAGDDGVGQNPHKAFELCREAALLGYPAAQYLLGQLYDSGCGTDEDAAQAVDWYRKAACNGDVSAQYELASRYEKGKDVPQDLAESLRWHRSAALQGCAQSQYTLGDAYMNGKGVDADAEYAEAWLRVLSANPNADALQRYSARYLIGDLYQHKEKIAREVGGSGLREANQAFRWTLYAASCDDPVAGYARSTIASFYWYGYGVPRNTERSRYWDDIAVKNAEDMSKLIDYGHSKYIAHLQGDALMTRRERYDAAHDCLTYAAAMDLPDAISYLEIRDTTIADMAAKHKVSDDDIISVLRESGYETILGRAAQPGDKLDGIAVTVIDAHYRNLRLVDAQTVDKAILNEARILDEMRETDRECLRRE